MKLDIIIVLLTWRKGFEWKAEHINITMFLVQLFLKSFLLRSQLKICPLLLVKIILRSRNPNDRNWSEKRVAMTTRRHLIGCTLRHAQREDTYTRKMKALAWVFSKSFFSFQSEFYMNGWPQIKFHSEESFRNAPFQFWWRIYSHYSQR